MFKLLRHIFYASLGNINSILFLRDYYIGNNDKHIYYTKLLVDKGFLEYSFDLAQSYLYYNRDYANAEKYALIALKTNKNTSQILPFLIYHCFLDDDNKWFKYNTLYWLDHPPYMYYLYKDTIKYNYKNTIRWSNHQRDCTITFDIKYYQTYLNFYILEPLIVSEFLNANIDNIPLHIIPIDIVGQSIYIEQAKKRVKLFDKICNNRIPTDIIKMIIYY